MAKLDDHPRARPGSWGEVRFFTQANKECPSKAYYDALTLEEQAQFQARFERLVTFGKLRSPDQYRQLSGDIYEIKTYDHRITCRQVRRRWFLLTGFPKKGQKTKKTDLKMAERVNEELQHWLDKGGMEVCT